MSLSAAGFTLFGFARGMEAGELEAVDAFLREAWSAQFGRAPSTLIGDMERLKPLFKTGASAKKLRETIAGLEPLRGICPELPDAIFIKLGDGRGLVTPEGRILLDELNRLRDTADLVIPREAVVRATSAAAQCYGDWQREWMRQQLQGGDLRPGTFGFVVFLLVNGSTDESRAFPLPKSREAERERAEPVTDVIDAFATALGGTAMKPAEASRLRSNWRVTEASRQLFGLVERADRGDDRFFWITDEDQLVGKVGERLASRRGLTYDALESALDASVAAYGRARPALSALELSHERRGHTQRVVEGVLEAFVRRRSSP